MTMLRQGDSKLCGMAKDVHALGTGSSSRAGSLQRELSTTPCPLAGSSASIVTLLLQLLVQMGLAQAAGVGSEDGDVLNPKFSLP